MYNPYLVIPFVVWIITQFLKFILAAAAGKLDFRYLYASGGMPSVHSAVVTSLVTTAFLVDGPQSPLFGITAILAAIVMYDSFGVRRSSGEQATAINVILDSLQEDKIRLNHPQHRLRELLGHKPLEVTVGAGLGFFLACLFNIDKLDNFITSVTSPVSQQMAIAMGGVATIILIGSIIVRGLYMKQYKKVPVVSQAIKQAFWLAVAFSVTSMIIAFFAYEKVDVVNWLLWPMIIIILTLATFGSLFNYYRKVIPNVIAENAIEEDKAKWFEGPNKKRRAAKAKSRKKK